MMADDATLLPVEVFEAKKKLQAFIDDELRPMEAELPLDDNDVPKASAEVAARVRERSKELGFFYMTQGKQIGGSQAGPLMLTALYETLAAAQLRLGAFIWGPGEGFMSAVVEKREDFPYLDENYLTPLLAGEKTSAFGFTEPENMPKRTSAVVDEAKGVFRINGIKSYVTGGDKATFTCVLANVVPEKAGQKGGSTMIIVDRDTPGVKIERVFGTIGGGTHAWMVFEDVEVPLDNAIGEIGQGLKRGLSQIAHVRLTMCANAVGIAAWTIDFVQKQLVQPHRTGTPLSAREGIQMRLADMRIEFFAARALLYRTAALAEALGRDEIEQETISTKVYCTEMCGRLVDTAVQLCGGGTLRTGHPLESLYRKVREFRFAEGASDLLRIKMAKAALRATEAAAAGGKSRL